MHALSPFFYENHNNVESSVRQPLLCKANYVRKLDHLPAQIFPAPLLEILHQFNHLFVIANGSR
jgi:hypothetical protein